MNVNGDQLLMIIGMKEVELVMLRQKISLLEDELKNMKEKDGPSEA